MDAAIDKYEALTGFGSASVLIVDDDQIAVRLLTRTVNSLGISVDSARDGVEALKKCRERNYRLVLSDWMMPGMSGTELCREIRKSCEPYVYFVLNSARNRREDRMEAYESGVDDFLGKPIDVLELQARLIVANRILLMHANLRSHADELREARDKIAGINKGLTIASNRFSELFNELPAPCFTCGIDGLIHEWNRFAERTFCIEAFRAVDQEVWALLGDSSSGFWSRDLVATIFAGVSVSNADWTMRLADGTTRHLSASLLPIEGPDGAIVGVVCVSSDVTDRLTAKQMSDRQMADIQAIAVQLSSQKRVLELQNDELSKQAITDGLTGLWNHRKFREELRAAFFESKSTGTALCVILADVDQFKAFNDEFGHLAGDEILRQVSAIFAAETAAFGQPARYGGEEFAIVVPGADAEASVALAETLRIAVEAARWAMRPITVSFGVAEIDSATVSAQHLLERADVALYRAKADGRNCVRASDGSAVAHRRRRADRRAA